MKKSNKILVGALLALFLIMASLHAAIYVKYKRGEYTAAVDDFWQPNLAKESIQGVTYVKVKNLSNVSVHASDTARLEYQKEGRDEFQLNRSGDTLLVGPNGGRSGFAMHVYLAPGMMLEATDAQLHLKGSGDSARLPSFNLRLVRSEVELGELRDGARFFDGLTLDAQLSRMHLYDAQIRSLSARLMMNSELTDNLATVDSVRLSLDVSSRINLSGQPLSKIKLLNNE